MNARLDSSLGLIGSDQHLRELMHDIEQGAGAARVRACKLDRRTFLKLTGMAGGGLLLGFQVGEARAAAGAAADFVPNAFLRISPKGQILIFSKGPEIGQGIKTAFPLIIAEELEVNWKDVVVVQGDLDAAYGNQSAGGSRSTPTNYDAFLKLGATARTMLLEAAAQTWGVPAAECHAAGTAVHHAASKRSLKYGDLVAKAPSIASTSSPP